MIGGAILQKTADLRLEGLLDGDTIGTTLVAATLADALRKGITPREVAEALFETLPSDEHWNLVIREAVDVACDAHDNGIEAADPDELDEAA